MIRGKLAKKQGQEFEQLFKTTSENKGFLVYPIPPGCKRISLTKLIAVKTPFDYIVVNQFGDVGFFDVKSFKSKTVSFSMLKEHQVEALYNAHIRHVVAGYVVHHTPLDLVVFYDALKLNGMAPRSSIGQEEGTIIGVGDNFDLNLVFSRRKSESTYHEPCEKCPYITVPGGSLLNRGGFF